MEKITKNKQIIFTLVAEVGRSKGDGSTQKMHLEPPLCVMRVASMKLKAVRETIAVLKISGMAPLNVSGYGSIKERIDEGHDIDDHEYDLMEKAMKEKLCGNFSNNTIVLKN